MKNTIFLFITIIIIAYLTVSDNKEKSSYLVLRIDNKYLQRYEFTKPQIIGDTVIIYDEIPGADGPIYIPIKAIVKDTIL